MEFINIPNQKEQRNNKNYFYVLKQLKIMTLDTKFREQTDKLINETLELYKSAGASPRISQVWKCQNTGDFLCGFFVGEMVGSALSAFQVFHKREQIGRAHV